MSHRKEEDLQEPPIQRNKKSPGEWDKRRKRGERDLAPLPNAKKQMDGEGGESPQEGDWKETWMLIKRGGSQKL